MGYDYFESINIVFECENFELEICESSNGNYKTDSYDSDIEETLDEQMERIERTYGEKLIYSDGKWIKDEYSSKYLKVLEIKEIKLSDVIRIYKYKSCRAR